MLSQGSALKSERSSNCDFRKTIIMQNIHSLILIILIMILLNLSIFTLNYFYRYVYVYSSHHAYDCYILIFFGPQTNIETLSDYLAETCQAQQIIITVYLCLYTDILPYFTSNRKYHVSGFCISSFVTC